MQCSFSASVDDLKEWTSIITKAFNYTRQFNEMLKCVRFLVSKDGVSVSANDGISYIRVFSLDCLSCSGEGSFLVRTDLLHKIVSSTKKDSIDFDISDTIRIKTNSTYKVPRISDEGYPEQTKPDYKGFIEFSDPLIVEVLDKMIPFISSDMVRPELSGVSVSQYLYASTDGHHGVVHLRVEEILPIMTVYPYVIRTLKSMSDLNRLAFFKDDSSFWLTNERFVYSCKLPVNEFPYSALYKALENRLEYRYLIQLPCAAFLDALDRVMLLSTSSMDKMTLSFYPNELKVSFESEDRNKTSFETVSAVVNFDDREDPICIYASVGSMSSLSNIFSRSTGTFEVSFDTPLKPVFVQADKSDYTFFFMPIRETV